MSLIGPGSFMHCTIIDGEYPVMLGGFTSQLEKVNPS